jgi:hypothetical protein
MSKHSEIDSIIDQVIRNQDTSGIVHIDATFFLWMKNRRMKREDESVDPWYFGSSYQILIKNRIFY